MKVGTVCLGQNASRSKPGGISQRHHLPTSAASPSRVAGAPQTRSPQGRRDPGGAPRAAAHTRRCRLRSSSPASRAQLIRAALQAPRLGPAEPHSARARRPCAAAADLGPRAVHLRPRARAPGGEREAGRPAPCGRAESVARPRRGHGGLHPVLSPRGERPGARLHGRPSPRVPPPLPSPYPTSLVVPPQSTSAVVMETGAPPQRAPPWAPSLPPLRGLGSFGSRARLPCGLLGCRFFMVCKFCEVRSDGKRVTKGWGGGERKGKKKKSTFVVAH